MNFSYIVGVLACYITILKSAYFNAYNTIVIFFFENPAITTSLKESKHYISSNLNLCKSR